MTRNYVPSFYEELDFIKEANIAKIKTLAAGTGIGGLMGATSTSPRQQGEGGLGYGTRLVANTALGALGGAAGGKTLQLAGIKNLGQLGKATKSGLKDLGLVRKRSATEKLKDGAGVAADFIAKNKGALGAALGGGTILAALAKPAFRQKLMNAGIGFDDLQKMKEKGGALWTEVSAALQKGDLTDELLTKVTGTFASGKGKVTDFFAGFKGVADEAVETAGSAAKKVDTPPVAAANDAAAEVLKKVDAPAPKTTPAANPAPTAGGTFKDISPRDYKKGPATDTPVGQISPRGDQAVPTPSSVSGVNPSAERAVASATPTTPVSPTATASLNEEVGSIVQQQITKNKTDGTLDAAVTASRQKQARGEVLSEAEQTILKQNPPATPAVAQANAAAEQSQTVLTAAQKELDSLLATPPVSPSTKPVASVVGGSTPSPSPQVGQQVATPKPASNVLDNISPSGERATLPPAQGVAQQATQQPQKGLRGVFDRMRGNKAARKVKKEDTKKQMIRDAQIKAERALTRERDKPVNVARKTPVQEAVEAPVQQVAKAPAKQISNTPAKQTSNAQVSPPQTRAEVVGVAKPSDTKLLQSTNAAVGSGKATAPEVSTVARREAAETMEEMIAKMPPADQAKARRLAGIMSGQKPQNSAGLKSQLQGSQQAMKPATGNLQQVSDQANAVRKKAYADYINATTTEGLALTKKKLDKADAANDAAYAALKKNKSSPAEFTSKYKSRSSYDKPMPGARYSTEVATRNPKYVKGDKVISELTKRVEKTRSQLRKTTEGTTEHALLKTKLDAAVKARTKAGKFTPDRGYYNQGVNPERLSSPSRVRRGAPSQPVTQVSQNVRPKPDLGVGYNDMLQGKVKALGNMRARRKLVKGIKSRDVRKSLSRTDVAGPTKARRLAAYLESVKAKKPLSIKELEKIAKIKLARHALSRS